MSETMSINESSEVKKIIKEILAKEKPKTVRKLSERVVELSNKNIDFVYDSIKEMELEGEIKLGSPKIERHLPKTISQYFFKLHYFSIEFWMLFGLTVVFIIVVLLIQPGSPFQFLRTIMGITYGLFIPGWTISCVLFPKLYETIDQIERTLLAIGINIGTMIFGGLILNQIWAIDNLPFVIMLSSVTLLSLVAATTIRILLGSGKIDLGYNKIKDKFAQMGDSNAKSS